MIRTCDLVWQLLRITDRPWYTAHGW